MTPRQTLNERLAKKRALLGLLQTHPSPPLAEAAGMCGYDFIVVDNEHGLFCEMDHLYTAQALAGNGIAGLVRLANHDAAAIGRYLDIGVDGIIVPDVRTAQQAYTLARAMVYAPAGTRGFGAATHRLTRYGMDVAAHADAPRAGASLFVLIESAEGVANCREIASVEGIDGMIVGPADLSASLGRLHDFANPAYEEALCRVERAALQNGKLLGTAPHGQYSLKELFARGHRLFILDADMALMCAAMSAQVEEARSSLAR